MSNVAILHTSVPRTSTRTTSAFTRAIPIPTSAPLKKEHTSLFNVVPQNIIRGKGVCETLSFAERGYLSALISICGKNGACFYTLPNLALELKTSVSTIYRFNKKLKELKLITIEDTKNQTLCIRVCTTMIWENNDKIYPISTQKKPCFFDQNSVSNRPNPPSNCHDPSTRPRAQTDVNLTHGVIGSFSNEKREGEGASTPTDQQEPTDQSPETPPPSDIFLEEKVYPEEIKRIAAEVSKFSFLPVTPALLDFLTLFTERHPQIDVVLAAQDARRYANEHRNGMLNFSHYEGTCRRWIEFQQRDTPSRAHQGEEERYHEPPVTVSSEQIEEVLLETKDLLPNMTQEQAEALAQDIREQGNVFGYTLPTKLVASRVVPGTWVVAVEWPDEYYQTFPKMIRSRAHWENKCVLQHAETGS